MRKTFWLIPAALLISGLSWQAVAQSPAARERGAAPAGAAEASASPLVTRMMAFNKKGDGKLTKDEVTDKRLLRLFDQADANHDGIVTKEELTALATKLAADQGGAGDRGPGDRGPGDRGPGDRGPGERAQGDRGPGERGPNDRGPGGRRNAERGPGDRGPNERGPNQAGGRGRGPGGPPQPGELLNPREAEELDLTVDQKSKLEAIQKEATEKVEQLLTPEQRTKLKGLRERGPGAPPSGGQGIGQGGRGPQPAPPARPSEP
ncbi:MAG TPA: EF-hand domain-containing protein [Pirellulales bacterium]|nr:EF-hand domain-containing protein [Pirellulales bacterium]